MVLAVAAPLVALYYHSSAWAGPFLGQGSTLLALAVGSVIFACGVMRKQPDVPSRKALVLPVTVLTAVHAAMLIQLVAIAAPILPERTVFSHGIDHVGDAAQ
jgi:hypothetical protein